MAKKETNFIIAFFAGLGVIFGIAGVSEAISIRHKFELLQTTLGLTREVKEDSSAIQNHAQVLQQLVSITTNMAAKVERLQGAAIFHDAVISDLCAFTNNISKFGTHDNLSDLNRELESKKGK